MAQKKKKPNDVGSQCRNYKDELDIVYGGDSDVCASTLLLVAYQRWVFSLLVSG